MKAKYRIVLLLSCALLLPAATHSLACSTPVYQYALQRWYPDLYEVLVFHKGELTDEQKAVVKRFEAPVSEDIPPANVIATTVDVSGDMQEELTEIYEKLGAVDVPVVALMYPRMSRIPDVIWKGPLSDASVKLITDSPIRQQVSARIIQGDVTTWILLESGDEQKDAAAESKLRKELDEMQKALDEATPEVDPSIVDDPWDPTPVRPEHHTFSIIRMPRGNPDEAVFEAMLIKSEPDLDTFKDEPVIFPVFGQGRALFTLVGEGINADNIAGTCWFVSGPCACEVKAQNPGLDLLIAANWERALEQLAAIEDVEPVLTSVLPGPTNDVGDVDTNAAPDIEEVPPQAPDSGLVGPIAIAFILVVVAVVVGSVVIMRRGDDAS